MGYLTTVTIHNDVLNDFEQHPKEFAEAVFEGIRMAQRHGMEVSSSLKGYVNYIHVQPSRHADDTTVYVHYGNTVFNLNPWNLDFKALAEKNPKVLEEFIKVAESIVEEARERLERMKDDSEV